MGRIWDFNDVFPINLKLSINELINSDFGLFYFIFREFRSFLLVLSILLIIKSFEDFVKMIIYFIDGGYFLLSISICSFIVFNVRDIDFTVLQMHFLLLYHQGDV